MLNRPSAVPIAQRPPEIGDCLGHRDEHGRTRPPGRDEPTRGRRTPTPPTELGRDLRLRSTSRSHPGIGVGQGTAIYVAAILGAGILALPSLAAKIAGPASILSWVGLVLLSIPIAATFAALGARYPDGGGVATFVSKAAVVVAPY